MGLPRSEAKGWRLLPASPRRAVVNVSLCGFCNDFLAVACVRILWSLSPHPHPHVVTGQPVRVADFPPPLTCPSRWADAAWTGPHCVDPPGPVLRDLWLPALPRAEQLRGSLVAPPTNSEAQITIPGSADPRDSPLVALLAILPCEDLFQGLPQSRARTTRGQGSWRPCASPKVGPRLGSWSPGVAVGGKRPCWGLAPEPEQGGGFREPQAGGRCCPPPRRQVLRWRGGGAGGWRGAGPRADLQQKGGNQEVTCPSPPQVSSGSVCTSSFLACERD